MTARRFASPTETVVPRKGGSVVLLDSISVPLYWVLQIGKIDGIGVGRLEKVLPLRVSRCSMHCRSKYNPRIGECIYLRIDLRPSSTKPCTDPVASSSLGGLELLLHQNPRRRLLLYACSKIRSARLFIDH